MADESDFNMEYWWDYNWRRKLNYLAKNMSQCSVVHHKS